MGTLAVPALRRLWREEGNPSGRYATLAALSLAQGAATDSFAIGRVEHSTHLRERAFALICLALGPQRRSGGAAVQKLLSSKRGGAERAMLRIAACLAGRRYGLEPDAGWYASDDPGIAAAVRFCRPRLNDVALERWVGPRPGQHHQLVLRGAMLGVKAHAALAPALESRVKSLLAARAQVPAQLASCAALCAVRAISADALFSNVPEGFPSLDLLPILSARVDHRQRLEGAIEAAFASGRLGATDRARLAVAMALGLASLDRDAAQRRVQLVTDDPSKDVREVFLFALAAELFERAGGRARCATLELPSDPAREWVRLACGAEAAEVRFADAAVTRAYARARTGTLPGPAAARLLRAALGRAAVLPGFVRNEAEVDLIRDLLVSGSEVGTGVDAVAERSQVYFPKGLAPGDAMFDVALRLLRFVRARAPWPRIDPGRYR